ncbi:MAG: hypothetical protein QHH30_09085 [candidate division NC10 bacterium]|nr:hypothetical protein [candidate division NC10 bacterium]
MNFIIGWILGIIAVALAIIAGIAWAVGSHSQRNQAQQQKQ